MNKDELAKAFGLKTYDTALPQEWWNRAYAITEQNASDFAIVWAYDGATYGFPCALDLAAARFLWRVRSA